MRLNASILGVAVALAISGCQTADLRSVRSDIDDELTGASALLESTRQANPRASDSASFTVEEDGYYGRPEPRELSKDRTLPFKCDIVFNPTTPMSVTTFAQVVSRNSGCRLQTRVSQDALTALAGGFSTHSTAPLSAPAPIPALPALPGLPANGGSVRSGVFAGGDPSQIMEQYTGDVASLLDIVTSKLGLSWRYRDGGVSIFYLDTRFIPSFSIPSAASVESTVTLGSTTGMGTSASGQSGMGGGVGGGNAGVSGNATSSQSTTVSAKTDSASQMEKVVQSMLTPEVGRMAVGMGGFVVTDRPEVLDRIEGLVGQHNQIATQQVLMNFKIISVKLNSSNEYGINWEGVWKSISSKFGVNLVGGAASNGEAVNASISILEGSPFSGSKLIMSALSQQGDVAVVYQPSISALNLKPAPMQIGDQTSYIQRAGTNLASNVGSTTSLEQGSVTTGFGMNLLPYILPDKKTILLHFGLNLSSLKQLRRFENKDVRIESPDIKSQIVNHEIMIRSGETLVMSGFEQSTLSNDDRGVGNPRFKLFGGSAKKAREREVLVVLATPIVQSR